MLHVHACARIWFDLIFKFCLFIFGCAGSPLLHRLFSRCGEWGHCSLVAVLRLLTAVASCFGTWAPRHTGLSSCGTWAQQLWLPGSGAQPEQLSCMGLVAPRHVGASWTRDRTSASCIGRQVLYHWAAREAPISVFLLTKNYCHGVVMEQGMWNTKHIPVMWRISDPC